MSDFGDDAKRKRREFQLSRRSGFHTSIDDQHTEKENELRQITEFQERIRYRLLANQQNGLKKSSSLEEPDRSSRQLLLRLRGYTVSPGPVLVKAISLSCHFLILILILLPMFYFTVFRSLINQPKLKLESQRKPICALQRRRS